MSRVATTQVTYDPHPATLKIRPLSEAKYKELRDSIRMIGLRQPITIHKETQTILNGVHRYKACLELGIKLRSEAFWEVSTDNPEGFVQWNNDRKRQLTLGEKITLARALTHHILAKEVGMSDRSYDAYCYVEKHGIPSVIEAMKLGKDHKYGMAVRTARKIAGYSQERQDQIMKTNAVAILAK